MTSANPGDRRPDIQGLRAIAVTLVLVYHLRPALAAGGYVGVDVFFVISGFLITSHLLRHPPTTRRDLLEFWGRRIRRLLPAALLVLLVTGVATRLVAPASLWEPIAREIAASALYVENWVLAASAVDYLAADNTPTPVQHYWSLSLEEQFYLLWPVLLLGTFLVARRFRSSGTVAVRLAIGAVVAVSLAWSIVLTATEPGAAYFVTPTRMWELGLGALLAALPPLAAARAPGWVPPALAWSGLGLIVLAGLTFSDRTPFPGVAALIPAVGSALVILATADGRASPTPWLRLRPVQHVGDTSYSIYLWHWPLIVLVPFVIGPLGLVGALGIVVATLVLATLTKWLVEDPFRISPRLAALGPTYRFAAVGMVVVVGLATLQVAAVRQQVAASESRATTIVEAAGDCLGAASIVRGFVACPQDPAAPVVPDPTIARDDRPDAYADDCWSNAPYADHTTCRYGDGPVQVALVGNSHAGHWLPALQVLAARHGWTITTFLVSQCNLTDARLEFDTQRKADNCAAYGEWVQAQTSGERFDLVITSERQSVPVAGQTMATTAAPARDGYASYLRRWTDAGTNLLILRDTPDPGRTLRNVPDCLAAHPGHADACDGTPTTWASIDPLADAAAGMPGIGVVDGRQWFCTTDRCPAVIGSVVAYFDASHMTATYSRTLADYLEPAVLRALGPGASGAPTASP